MLQKLRELVEWECRMLERRLAGVEVEPKVRFHHELAVVEAADWPAYLPALREMLSPFPLHRRLDDMLAQLEEEQWSCFRTFSGDGRDSVAVLFVAQHEDVFHVAFFRLWHESIVYPCSSTTLEAVYLRLLRGASQRLADETTPLPVQIDWVTFCAREGAAMRSEQHLLSGMRCRGVLPLARRAIYSESAPLFAHLCKITACGFFTMSSQPTANQAPGLTVHREQRAYVSGYMPREQCATFLAALPDWVFVAKRGGEIEVSRSPSPQWIGTNFVGRMRDESLRFAGLDQFASLDLQPLELIDLDWERADLRLFDAVLVAAEQSFYSINSFTTRGRATRVHTARPQSTVRHRNTADRSQLSAVEMPVGPCHRHR